MLAPRHVPQQQRAGGAGGERAQQQPFGVAPVPAAQRRDAGQPGAEAEGVGAQAVQHQLGVGEPGRRLRTADN